MNKFFILIGIAVLTIYFASPTTVFSEEQQIPEWIKNNAKWWVDKQITNSDFFAAMSHLIKNQILEIPDISNSQNKVTQIFVIDGPAQITTDEEIEIIDLDRVPLNQYLPDRKAPTGKSTNEWIMDKEGSDQINYQGKGVQGYHKDFSKLKDDSILEASVYRFDSGGDAWGHNNARINEIKETEVEKMDWPSRPSECVGFVEEINYKYSSWIYCVFGDLGVHLFGFGRTSEQDTQDSTGVIVGKINDVIIQGTKPEKIDEKSVSNILTITMSSDEILIPLRSSNLQLEISGNVAETTEGTPLIIYFSYPDGSQNQIVFYLTDQGDFSGVFPVSSNLPVGKYHTHFSYKGITLGTMSFSVYRDVPDWVKDNSKMWAEGEMSDDAFLKGIKNLASHGLIRVG